MMKKPLYYVMYDISSNKIRSKVIHILKDAGLIRVQYSVFCGPLNFQQRKDLEEKLRTVVNEGSVYLILCCKDCFGKIITIGASFDKDYVTGKKEARIL